METYKITKTIRFKLEAKDENIPEIQKDIAGLDNNFDLANFLTGLNHYINDIDKYLFEKKKNGNSVINGKITIKPDFLKNYAKQEWVNFQEKNKLTQNATQNSRPRKERNSINEFTGLDEKIKQTFKEVADIYETLANDASAGLNERAKREHTGLLLKRLQAKNTLPYLISLAENSNNKNETDDLSIQLKNQSSKLEQQLAAGIREFLPAQSSGLPVAKASFNYYTINKAPIDFIKRIEELKKNLKVDDLQKLNSFFDKKSKKNKLYFHDNLFKLIQTDVQEQLKNNKILLLGDTSMLDIENYISLRQVLKNIKSTQKKKFSEWMQTDKNYDDLKKTELYLFKNISLDQFIDYREKTKELEELAVKINQAANGEERKSLISKKEAVAKIRGNIMKDKFEAWKSFANFYRSIAQKHGRILAQLKGIEKEQTESQLLKYWALVLESNNQHKLVLIPRENSGECKKWLEENDNRSSPGSRHIFWFESFTYRSLQKLCFGNLESGTNTFNKTIQNLLLKYSKGKPINGEFAFEGDEQKKIKFYKDVLQNQTTLNLPQEKVQMEIINKNFASLGDFQIALEKICYRRFIVLNSDAEKILLNKFYAQIFDIISLDLKNLEIINNKQEKYLHNDKRHTQIWKEFWTSKNEENSFDIRLNPEIIITYRQPKQSRIDKYGQNSKLSNRYLHPQFTLITTISEHSNSPTRILSFVTDEEFKNSVDEFNKKLKKDNIKFAFGIDNGEKELSTLVVYLPEFSKRTPEEKIAELKQIEKYGFEVLTINDLNYKESDYNGKERKIIQNPSYFLKKENYMRTFDKSEREYDEMFEKLFKKKRTLTLNLTTAKVICGHIVTNGDVPALFNLWLKHAQRNIFEMNDHIKDETAKRIILKNKLDTNKEKLKFAEYISHKEKFDEFSEVEQEKYVHWIFEDREKLDFTTKENSKFNDCTKRKGDYRTDILFASCFIGDELRSVTDIFDCRHIFKKHDEFYSIKSEKEIAAEIESFNTNRTSHDISNEELDLKIVDAKKALVANAVGVIDFLYKKYKERFNGEGLIVKEGFGTREVEQGIEKFSGNIYRILERKLYQKFQNYGLVPPIKSLMAIRSEGLKGNKKAILQLGNVCFIAPDGTSQNCPICETKMNNNHADEIVCKVCGFESKNIMHSNDEIAGFNIAKRGFENFN